MRAMNIRKYIIVVDHLGAVETRVSELLDGCSCWIVKGPAMYHVDVAGREFWSQTLFTAGPGCANASHNPS